MPATTAGRSGKSLKVGKKGQPLLAQNSLPEDPHHIQKDIRSKRKKLYNEDSDFVELPSEELDEQPQVKKKRVVARKVTKNDRTQSEKSLGNNAVKRRRISLSSARNENIEESGSSTLEQQDIEPPSKKRKSKKQTSLSAVQAPKLLQNANRQSIAGVKRKHPQEELESLSSEELGEQPLAKKQHLAAQKKARKNIKAQLAKNKKKTTLPGVDVEKHFVRKNDRPVENSPLKSFRVTDMAKTVFRDHGYVPMVEDMYDWQKSAIARMYSMGYTLNDSRNNICGQRRDTFLRIFEGLSVEKLHPSYFSPMYTIAAAIYHNRELPEIKPIFRLYTKLDVAPQFFNFEIKFIVNRLIFDLDLKDEAYPEPVNGQYPGIPAPILERLRSTLSIRHESLHTEIGILLKNPKRYELDKAWKIKETLKIWTGEFLLGIYYLHPRRLTTRSNIMGPLYIKTPADRLMEKIKKQDGNDPTSAGVDSLRSESRNLERPHRIVIDDDGKILPEECENTVKCIYQANPPEEVGDLRELVDDDERRVGFAMPNKQLCSVLGYEQTKKKKKKPDKTAEVPPLHAISAVGDFSAQDIISGKHLSALCVGSSVLVKLEDKPLWPGVILAINTELEAPTYDVNLLAVNNVASWSKVSKMPANTVFRYDLAFMVDIQSKEETEENHLKFYGRTAAITLFEQWQKNPTQTFIYPDEDCAKESKNLC